MTSSMIPFSATAQRVASLECAPCALRHAMQRRGQLNWTPPLADFAVDLVAGALTLADATEVLVPSSLVHYMEEFRAQQQQRQPPSSSSNLASTLQREAADGTSSPAWPWPIWDAALREHRLVTWATAEDAARLLRGPYATRYTNFCVPVPAGPLVSQMDFGVPVDVFYTTKLPRLLDAVSEHQRRHSDARGSHHPHEGSPPSAGNVRWRAWLRGALTCAYEGTHVPPIRMADYTSQLLRQDGGCDRVLWEAAVAGLTPRWLETATKTALAVGISPAALTLALPEEASCTARLLSKSVEVGITSWTTCALTHEPLYPHADPLCTPQSLRVFTTGWNEAAATAASVADESAEAALVQCADYVDAVQERYRDVLS